MVHSFLFDLCVVNGLDCELYKVKKINVFFRNLIGFVGCSIYSSMAPLMLGNLIFLNSMM